MNTSYDIRIYFQPTINILCLNNININAKGKELN